MDELKRELKNILDEREALVTLREQWQAKWEKLTAQINQNNIDLIVLRKEHENIYERVRAWQQRQIKHKAAIEEMATLIRQTIPEKIH